MKVWFEANRRKIAVVFMLVFAGGGLWFFSGRLPLDVALRFELPPFVQTAHGRLERNDMGHLAGVVSDADGNEVGRFIIEQRWAGDAPLSKPAALRLKRGTYRVELKVDRDARLFAMRPPEQPAELAGAVEVVGPGEVRVDVRSTRGR